MSPREDKGYRFDFFRGQFLLWNNNSSFETVKFIGAQIRVLYPLITPSIKARLKTLPKLVRFGIKSTLIYTTKLWEY